MRLATWWHNYSHSILEISVEDSLDNIILVGYEDHPNAEGNSGDT